jgi:maltose/moltooligosaccharide transporter
VKPKLGFWQLWNISFGFFGIQVGFALQGANVSRIFQTLGASIDDLPILWIAGPVTGLLVQPIVGYLSDRTWTRLGRRRPYFLVGAILSTLALVLFPHAGALWVAAGLLWMLDASINVSMEPFRAFVGDMLGKDQRTAGYAFQTAFIGVGAVVASLAPIAITNWLDVANTAPEGVIPPSVRYAFYAGGVALFLAVLWTVLSTREYSPEELAAEGETTDVAPYVPAGGLWWMLAGAGLFGIIAWLGLDNPLYVLAGCLFAFGLAQLVNRRTASWGWLRHILSDLHTMSPVMRRLALVQFFSWFALFIMWVYTTPIVTQHQFGATDVTSQAYNDGADWVGVLFAVYNGVAALYAFVLPAIARRFGRAATHLGSLAAGAAGFLSFLFIKDPDLLLLSMVGVGVAWCSILTMPYAILCDALPQNKLGVYMGLFNIFIVLPQLMVSTVMGTVSRTFFPDAPVYAMRIAAGFMLAAAAATTGLSGRGEAAPSKLQPEPQGE